MEQYNVTGMSCAACSNRVEKAVLGVPGVTSCAVSLLTNSMGIINNNFKKSTKIPQNFPYFQACPLQSPPGFCTT